MTRKELVMVIIVLALGLGAGGLVLATTSDNTKKESKTSQTDHDNSAPHHQGSQEAPADAIDETANKEVQMDIKDFAYAKQHIKIKKGTKVTWTNRDSVQHNVMAEHDGAGAVHDAPKSNEIDPDRLAGPLLAQGESYSFTFTEVGSQPYHCSPHPDMKGSVTVVE